MAVRNIKKVWDKGKIIKDNVQFLLQKTKKVTFPLTPKDKEIIEDLIDTYNKIPSAGIAANQIGYNKMIFIGNTCESESSENKRNDYEIYINPQIDNFTNDSLQEGPEGCLSIPGITLNVVRYDNIKVRYYELEGKKVTNLFTGFHSRLFQHELDHLKGKLMVMQNVTTGRVEEREIFALYEELTTILFNPIICPFYRKEPIVPFANEFNHICSSPHLKGNCKELVEEYCTNQSRTYTSCRYFDNRLVL
tara:strand:+ start:295 stop:1041 length:747 start_codon:yes stop_codon:yes gene_type:complete